MPFGAWSEDYVGGHVSGPQLSSLEQRRKDNRHQNTIESPDPSERPLEPTPMDMFAKVETAKRAEHQGLRERTVNGINLDVLGTIHFG